MKYLGTTFGDRPIGHDVLERALDIMRAAIVRQIPSQIEDNEPYFCVDFHAPTGTLNVWAMTRDTDGKETAVEHLTCPLYGSASLSAEKIMSGLDKAYRLITETLRDDCTKEETT